MRSWVQGQPCRTGAKLNFVAKGKTQLRQTLAAAQVAGLLLVKRSCVLL